LHRSAISGEPPAQIRRRYVRAAARPRGSPRELSAIETRHLKAGDVIRFERSGGAGFGPPAERAAEAVRDDVRNGYVSPQAAADIYRRPQDEA
jgi:N-methylhydantoinase B